MCGRGNSSDDGDKKSQDGAPSPVTDGRVQAFVVIAFSTIFAILSQAWIGPEMKDWSAWEKGDCGELDEDQDDYSEIHDVCLGNMASLRVSMAVASFFFLMMLGALSSPRFNSENWMAKYLLFAILLTAYWFTPNFVFDNNGYAWIARVGSFCFMVLQVIILLDGAYNLNDSWVEKADNGEEEYLKYLVGISLFLYTSSFVGLVLLFTYFGGCPANDFFNSMTLIVTVAMTVIQLTGQYGTLFTGAVVTSYAVYLDYTACSQNPS